VAAVALARSVTLRPPAEPDRTDPSATRSMSWDEARSAAAAACGPVPARRAGLEAAAGAVLAADVPALTDLPAHDTSAMDGWAVAGAPPWRLVGEVRAGDVPAGLAHGTAVAIAT
jgi:molybdopterin molybdotransferase